MRFCLANEGRRVVVVVVVEIVLVEEEEEEYAYTFDHIRPCVPNVWDDCMVRWIFLSLPSWWW